MTIRRREPGTWFKSSSSPDKADCVEVSLGTTVGIRDTKARTAGELEVPEASWSAFLTAVVSAR
jgi:hypothetical protein